MNLFALASLLCWVFCFFLAAIALIYGRAKIHRILALTNLAVALWGFGMFIVGLATAESTAFMGWKITHASGKFIAPLFFHLVCVFCERRHKVLIFLNYLYAIIFSVVILFTDKVIYQLRFVYGLYYNVPNLLYSITLFIYVGITFYGFCILWSYIKREKGEKRSQALYIFVGFLLGFLGGTSTFLPEYRINIIYPFWHFSMPFYILTITYAILKHKLMDIKVGFSRASFFAMIFTIVIGIPLGLAYFNVFSLSGITVTITSLLLAFIVLIYAKEKIHYLWILFNSAVALWGVGIFLVGRVVIPETALFNWRMAYLGGLASSVLFYHIACIFCGLRRRWVIAFAYAQLIFFGLVMFFKPALVSAECRVVFQTLYFQQPTVVFNIMVFMWAVIFCAGFYELYQFTARSSGVKRVQGYYLLFGFLLGFLGMGLILLPAWGIPLYPFAGFGVALYTILGTYAVLRYRLLDIGVVLTNAGIFVIVYAMVLGLPFVLAKSLESALIGLWGKNWWFVVLALGIFLASAGPFIYQYLRNRAERVILKEQKRYQTALIELSKSMTQIRDPEQLFREIVLAISGTANISFCGLYLKENEYQWFKLKSFNPQFAKERIAETIPLNSRLVDDLLSIKRPILSEETVSLKQTSSDAAMAIPCFMKDELMCFLILGAKVDNQFYTPDDILVFETLSYSISLAIENSQFWQAIEARQREARLAEMDTYSYSLAHEIDNPVQMVLGHSELLEKDLQSASVDENKRKDIQESLFFIKDSAQRVAKMVKAIRDFGQPVTGEYKPINIVDVIDDFRYLYLPKLKEEEVTLTVYSAKEPFITKGEKTELVQVLVILGNNALHAMKHADRKEIVIETKKLDNGFARIAFKDTGCGIKKDLLHIIFTPFTTTKASVEGTGMGLYNAKKIIERHKGKIWAESEGEGGGAVFYVEVPVVKE